jgi:hypothetical protein
MMNAVSAGVWKDRPLVIVSAVVAMALVLGLFTTTAHVRARGFEYLEEGNQLIRHQAVLEGDAGDPWQYRVLPAFIAEGVLVVLETIGVPHHVGVGFMLFRVVIDAAILALAVLYYRRLGLTLPLALVGSICLAWGMSYSHYNSDLQFSTFLGVVLYLVAALCVLDERYAWILPLTVLAAFNRETSGLIPLLPLGVEACTRGMQGMRRAAPLALASLVGFGLVFFGLRWLYEAQALVGGAGHAPGLGLVWHNLTSVLTWERGLATMSVLPILAMAGYGAWPTKLRGLFWVVVPVWVLVHLWGAVIAETRVLLVPHAMVMVPGALFWVQRLGGVGAKATPQQAEGGSVRSARRDRSAR